FSWYLQQERVLAPTTVANYVSLIKKFLTHRFGTGPAHLSDLTAAQVVPPPSHPPPRPPPLIPAAFRAWSRRTVATAGNHLLQECECGDYGHW
ncbi:MAG TPA: hypothetical protein VFE61_05385, partial [Candidatus Sulfotelmatobacter sp.]|nr:hypothetical protein [Candidatus Sulfotelmatobacter sp.]